MAKLGATDEAFAEAIGELNKTVRTPEQIELIGVEAAGAREAEASASAPRPADVEPGRVPLFPADRRPDDGGEGEAPEPGKKAGRPPGSRNKSTSINRAYILGTFGDPLAMLARRNMMDLPSLLALAEKLQCKPIELFNAQNTALAKMLPFVHSPQPAAVKVEGKGAIAMVFSGVPVDKAGDEEAEGSDWAAIENMARRIAEDREQNQGVSVREVEPSNVTFSNGDGEKQGGSDA